MNIRSFCTLENLHKTSQFTLFIENIWAVISCLWNYELNDHGCSLDGFKELFISSILQSDYTFLYIKCDLLGITHESIDSRVFVVLNLLYKLCIIENYNDILG